VLHDIQFVVICQFLASSDPPSFFLIFSNHSNQFSLFRSPRSFLFPSLFSRLRPAFFLLVPVPQDQKPSAVLFLHFLFSLLSPGLPTRPSMVSILSSLCVSHSLRCLTDAGSLSDLFPRREGVRLPLPLNPSFASPSFFAMTPPPPLSLLHSPSVRARSRVENHYGPSAPLADFLPRPFFCSAFYACRQYCCLPPDFGSFENLNFFFI